MFLALVKGQHEAMTEGNEKRYEKAYEQLRDSRLPDNCSADDFSKRINLFSVHVNPYLPEPLEGVRLGKFILS